jgi:hypothetical protein
MIIETYQFPAAKSTFFLDIDEFDLQLLHPEPYFSVLGHEHLRVSQL